MHIITGLVLAALLGKGKSPRLPALPRLQTGPVRVVHDLPGRVRLRVTALDDCGDHARILAERLPAIQGVQGVTVSPTTRSVLITYNPAAVRPALLFAAVVRLLGLDRAIDRPPRPVVARELRDVCRALNRAVYERTGGIIDLHTAVLIVFIALGVRKMLQQQSAILPAGLSMVWWAMNGLLRETPRP
jgi:hypothetical protein